MIAPSHLFTYNTPNSFHNNYNQHHVHTFCSSFFAKHTKWLNLPTVNHNKTKVNNSLPTRNELADWQEIFIKRIARFSMIIGSAERGQSVVCLELHYFLFSYLRFSSLSVQDLITCTTIDSSNFIQLFLKNYRKAKNKLVHLPTSRAICSERQPLLCENSSILQSLIYVPALDPLLQLNFDHLTSKTVMKRLDEVTQSHFFQFSNRFVNKENPEQNLLWFNSNTFHPLENWLACEIEKNVLKFYFNRNKDSFCTKALKERLCANQKTTYLQKFLNIKLIDIEDGFLLKHQQELKLLRVEQQMLLKEKELNLINFGQDQTKKTKRRRKKVKRSLSDQSLNKPLSVIQTQASTNQDNYQGLQISLFALRQDLHLIDKTDCQPQQNIIDLQVHSPLKLIFKSSERTNDQLSQQQIQKLQEQNTFKQQNDHQAKELFQQAQVLDEGEQMKKRRRRKNEKNINRIQQKLKQKVTHKIINKQLDSLLDTLSMQSNQKFQSKVVAFQRVRYVVRSMYPFSEAVLFGSNAVGLSLPTSDIDIMLVGLHYTNKDELCHYLSQIEIFLNNIGWVVSCSIIPQAKVPILKLQIDTRVNLLQPKMMNNQTFIKFPTVLALDLNDNAKGSILKVDITISSDINGASPTTELMRSQISQNSSIQRILLALKYILTVRGYSQNFKGGIGSYCLFIMVTAYFHHFQQRRQLSDGQKLLDILKFYGEQFDNLRKTVILSFDSRDCFIESDSNEPTQQMMFRTPLMVINPLNNAIISSNCYQYPLIKAEWRKIREEIIKIEQYIEAQINTSFSNTSEMSKMLSNQKGLERWINRIQGKITISVGNILSGKY